MSDDGSDPRGWSDETRHREAAHALLEKFYREDVAKYGKDVEHWVQHNEMYTGCLPNGEYAHVLKAE